jgi:hypothetical protein
MKTAAVVALAVGLGWPILCLIVSRGKWTAWPYYFGGLLVAGLASYVLARAVL